MTLISVDAQTVIDQSKDHSHKKHSSHGSRRILHQSWSRDEDAADVPKYTIPKVGIPSKAAYQLLHDESALDGNPLLNLASWVWSFISFQCRSHYATVSFIHGCHLMLKNLSWKILIRTSSIWMNTRRRPSFTIAAYQWVRSTRLEIDSWSYIYLMNT